MGERQEILRNSLILAGLHVEAGWKPAIAGSSIASEYWPEIERTYSELGGILAVAPLGVGKYDMVVDGHPTELDEEQHFNRYRLVTLGSRFYKAESEFAGAYRGYCLRHEQYCLRKANHGGYWTNGSTERQFGSPSAPPDLDNGGAPRWKQRAFYDFMKDVHGASTGQPVIRLSVWDRVTSRGEARPLGRLLDVGLSGEWLTATAELWQRRVEEALTFLRQ